MNPLRLNLVYAIFSFTFLLSLVSVSHPDSGPARRALRVTQRSAAALSKLPAIRCDRGILPRIYPAGGLKQIIHLLR